MLNCYKVIQFDFRKFQNLISVNGFFQIHHRLHSGDKPYKCEFCGRFFRQWGDLKYHVTSLHSNTKMFQCEYCGKDFARKYSLVVHRRIHTGEKNYICEYCTKTFRAASYLQNHRRIHTGNNNIVSNSYVHVFFLFVYGLGSILKFRI